MARSYKRTIEVPKIGTKRWLTWASTTGIGTSGPSPAIASVFGTDVDIIGTPGPVPNDEATMLRCTGKLQIWNQDGNRDLAGVIYMAAGSNWGIDKDLLLGHIALSDAVSSTTNAAHAVCQSGKAINIVTWDTKAMRKLDEHWKGSAGPLVPNVLIGYVYGGGSPNLHIRVVISCLIGFK